LTSCSFLDFIATNQKPVPTNAVHQLGTEISKDTGKLLDMEKVRETKSTELRTTEARIKEVGQKYAEKVSFNSERIKRGMGKVKVEGVRDHL